VVDRARLANSDEDLARLESEIALRGSRLAASLAELHVEVERLADWREWYRRHPGAYLALAFAAGWTLARLTGRRSGGHDDQRWHDG
jgi:hypothetical protein